MTWFIRLFFVSVKNDCFCTQFSREDAPPVPVEDTPSLDKVLLDLRSKLARGNYIQPWVMEGVKNILKTEPALTPKDALQLLEVCGSKLPDVPKSERTSTALTLWNHFEKQRLRIDTRMCNALLTAHLDNEHRYSPKEFLAWMRSVGIEADAETFSLFIGRYCQASDIGEATATLEVMQARGMSTSRFVFNSLIRCNAAIGEVEEANKVMDVMRNGGLKVLGDTHSALIEGLVRSGRKWDDVKAVVVNSLSRSPGVRIHNKDMFDIIMALVRTKDFAAARDMLTILLNQPKDKGYFRIVRGVIPQAIFEGATELAFDIYATMDLNHPKRGKAEGEFVFRALLVREVKPDIIAHLIEKLMRGSALIEGLVRSGRKWDDVKAVVVNTMNMPGVCPYESEVNLNDETNNLALRVIEMCFEMDKLKYAQELSSFLRHKFGNDIMKHRKPDFFIRRNMEKIKDPAEQILFIIAIKSVGIRPSINSFANDIVPKLFATHQEEGEDPTFMLAILSDTLNSVSSTKASWNTMANALVRFLLNKQTSAGFDEALHFAFNDNFLLWPSEWHASLAKAYLATGNIDGMVDMVMKSAIVQGNQDGSRNMDANLSKLKANWPFQVLQYIHMNAHMYKPNEDPDRVLLVALRAIQKARMGLPRDSVESLRSKVRDPETLEMLRILHEMQGTMADFWTKARVIETDQKLVLKYAESKEISRKGQEPRVTGCRVSDKSLLKMEQLQRRLREVGHEQW